MTVEEYLEKLAAIARDHPGVDVKAFDPGDDYRTPSEFDPEPMWSLRDQVIYVDGDPE
jgi:hypothetical protein